MHRVDPASLRSQHRSQARACFDEKYLDRIFGIFQRLHNRTDYEGTGVGLAICRKIADRHGGTIEAHSEPDKGSRFVVMLPVKQVDEEMEDYQ